MISFFATKYPIVVNNISRIYNLQIFIIYTFYMSMLSIKYLDTQEPEYHFKNTC